MIFIPRTLNTNFLPCAYWILKYKAPIQAKRITSPSPSWKKIYMVIHWWNEMKYSLVVFYLPFKIFVFSLLLCRKIAKSLQFLWLTQICIRQKCIRFWILYLIHTYWKCCRFYLHYSFFFRRKTDIDEQIVHWPRGMVLCCLYLKRTKLKHFFFSEQHLSQHDSALFEVNTIEWYVTKYGTGYDTCKQMGYFIDSVCICNNI